jgi:hypothetical protein
MGLVSLADFQKYTNTFQNDTSLQESYLESAESIVFDYLGYDLLYKEYTETIIIEGKTNKIKLNAKPIQKLAGIKVNNISQPISNFAIVGNSLIDNSYFFVKNDIVSVNYFAGYKSAENSNDDPSEDDIIDGGSPDTIYDDDNYDGGTPFDRIYLLPNIIKTTVLRIAALLQTESDSNIGVTSKSFGESGSRTFVSFTNFDKYLLPISKYRIIAI